MFMQNPEYNQSTFSFCLNNSNNIQDVHATVLLQESLQATLRPIEDISRSPIERSVWWWLTAIVTGSSRSDLLNPLTWQVRLNCGEFRSVSLPIHDVVLLSLKSAAWSDERI